MLARHLRTLLSVSSRRSCFCQRRQNGTFVHCVTVRVSVCHSVSQAAEFCVGHAVQSRHCFGFWILWFKDEAWNVYLCPLLSVHTSISQLGISCSFVVSWATFKWKVNSQVNIRINSPQQFMINICTTDNSAIRFVSAGNANWEANKLGLQKVNSLENSEKS